jgi:hypothetical protein
MAVAQWRKGGDSLYLETITNLPSPFRRQKDNIMCKFFISIVTEPENHGGQRFYIAAAPDLLEACKKAVEYLEGIGLTQTEDGEEHPEYEMLRAAISRAEGETK